MHVPGATVSEMSCHIFSTLIVEPEPDSTKLASVSTGVIHWYKFQYKFQPSIFFLALRCDVEPHCVKLSLDAGKRKWGLQQQFDSFSLY